jgi:hypothetical protein
MTCIRPPRWEAPQIAGAFVPPRGPGPTPGGRSPQGHGPLSGGTPDASLNHDQPGIHDRVGGETSVLFEPELGDFVETATIFPRRGEDSCL